jgi:hypothetical protein
MSLLHRTQLILAALCTLPVGGLLTAEAKAQDKRQLIDTGNKPWVVYRYKLGIDSKDEILADFDREDQAIAVAKELREAEQRLDVSYSHKKRSDRDSSPPGQDPSAPRSDPPTGRPPLTPIVKLPRVDPGPYKFLDSYNDPFKKKMPNLTDTEQKLVGKWKFVRSDGFVVEIVLRDDKTGLYTQSIGEQTNLPLVWRINPPSTGMPNGALYVESPPGTPPERRYVGYLFPVGPAGGLRLFATGEPGKKQQ